MRMVSQLFSKSPSVPEVLARLAALRDADRHLPVPGRAAAETLTRRPVNVDVAASKRFCPSFR
jgi:hypothetical protein